MSSYKEITAQIQKLQAEAEKARKKELREVIADVRQKIEAYGLSLEDLGLSGQVKKRGRPAKAAKTRRSGAKRSLEPKYRDPDTGTTWTGVGRTPRWLSALEAQGKNREKYLIK